VLTAPFGFPYLVLNTKQGPLANMALRQAVQASLNDADMLGAGFGDPKFYSADANHYAKNTPFYSMAGTEQYGKGDAKKAAALAAFNAESDPKKRGALWGNIQSDVYTEVPYIRVGNFNSVAARSSKLDGYVAMPWPFFWNTGLQK